MFLERQPIHKRPYALTSESLFLLGCLSLFFIIPILPAYSLTSSDITIKSPTLNTQFTTASVPISGTFVSPTKAPSITVYIDGSAYAASVGISSTTTDITIGTWSVSLSAGNGWHTLKATMSDGNGAKSDSTQFYVNDGTVNQAQIKYPVINIEYTQTCKALLKEGITHSCPTLDKLIPFDTSNQRVSGKFVNGTHGWYRTLPQLKNAYQFYTTPTICVDCMIDANSQSSMQSIWIEPIGFSYTQHTFTGTTVTNYELNRTGGLIPYTSTVNEQNAGLLVYHDKFVDGSCLSAEIVYDNKTIPDTIKYLKGGCADKTYLNTTQTKVPNSPFSFANPYSSLHLKQMVSAIKATGGLGDCIRHHCSYTDLYKKDGW
jgi:hypothetical protein